ncbi:HD domain-containing protein [Candidatus Dojkabacteria bacterium]|nr:HD domain-containing protein [Candidatus Dojkabacteria bacterium]
MQDYFAIQINFVKWYNKLMKKTSKILDYLFELGVMKRRRVSGFEQFTSANHVTLAGHSYRAAILGMLLAEKEGCSAAKVGLMLLVHENGETRIGDPDMIATKAGIDKADAEKKAYKAQISQLDKESRHLLYGLFKEKHQANSLEAKVACDADILEHIISAKEFVDQGNTGAQVWLDATYDWYADSAREIFRDIEHAHFTDWISRV